MFFPAEEVIKQIEEFDGLEALRLEGNTVGVEAAKVIAKALEKKSELKVRPSSGWWGQKKFCRNTEGLTALFFLEPILSQPQSLLCSSSGKNNRMKI